MSAAPDQSRRDEGTTQDGESSRAALPLIWCVRFYQRWISPALPATCRFYPSCSAYGLTALRRFGPIKGTWLTMKRLGRCHPWNPGGVDHVPPRGNTASAPPTTHAHIIAKDD